MDLTLSKKQFADDMQQVSRLFLQVKEKLHAMDEAYSVHGFNSGPNAFVDADFNETNKHLSASIVQDAMFAIGTIDAAIESAGIEPALRNCLPGGLP